MFDSLPPLSQERHTRSQVILNAYDMQSTVPSFTRSTRHRPTRHRPNLSIDNSALFSSRGRSNSDESTSKRSSFGILKSGIPKGPKTSVPEPFGLPLLRIPKGSGTLVFGPFGIPLLRMPKGPKTSVPEPFRSGTLVFGPFGIPLLRMPKGPKTSVPDLKGSGVYTVQLSAGRRHFGSPVPASQAGPVLERTYAGGAKMELALDRSIHYQAVEKACSAWRHHVSDQAPREVGYGPESQDDDDSPSDKPPPYFAHMQTEVGQDRASEDAAVPRLLLAFTLDVQPNMADEHLGIRENFEFISLELDFSATSAGLVHLGGSHEPLSPASRHPIVRGFYPSDIASSGFLQSFGPTLYTPLHDAIQDSRPVTIGCGDEYYVYKSFERRIAARHKPAVIEGDKLAARNGVAEAEDNDPTAYHARGVVRAPTNSTVSSSGTTLTYGSSQYSSVSSSTTSSSIIESDPDFGSSCIRVMLKRDTTNETSWSNRRFPFLILLEPPYDGAGPQMQIDCRVKVDVSTIRQNLPGVTHRPSHRRNVSTSSVASDGGGSALPDFMKRRERKISSGLSATKPHPSSMETGSGYRMHTKAGKLEEEDETLVRIYPRKDAISKVSCAAGSVKDILYPAGAFKSRSISGTHMERNKHVYRRSYSTRPAAMPASPTQSRSLARDTANPPSYRQEPRTPLRTPTQASFQSSDSEYSQDSSDGECELITSYTHRTPPKDLMPNVEDLFEEVLESWTDRQLRVVNI